MAARILVVEDTESVRDLIATLLRDRGYEVHEAMEGNEALRKAKALKPDLIIMDVMLPNKTGFEICAALKGDPSFGGTRIMLLTSITQGSDEGEEYWRDKSKADDFVAKPFDAKDLIGRVGKLLGR